MSDWKLILEYYNCFRLKNWMNEWMNDLPQSWSEDIMTQFLLHLWREQPAVQCGWSPQHAKRNSTPQTFLQSLPSSPILDLKIAQYWEWRLRLYSSTRVAILSSNEFSISSNLLIKSDVLGAQTACNVLFVVYWYITRLHLALSFTWHGQFDNLITILTILPCS